MSAVLLLTGLLVLAYLGSFLVGGRTVRGAGLPSGVEYVALGFVLGPQVMDLLGADMLASFEPVVLVALGWLAFAVGLDFGHATERRVSVRAVALGTVGAALTGVSVAAATWLVARGCASARPSSRRCSPVASALPARTRRVTRSGGSSSATGRAGRSRTCSTRWRTPTISCPCSRSPAVRAGALGARACHCRRWRGLRGPRSR